jgi:PAS domain S-box-containing protein
MSARGATSVGLRFAIPAVEVHAALAGRRALGSEMAASCAGTLPATPSGVGRRRASFRAYAIALLLVAGATFGARVVMAALPLRDPGMFFVAAVLVSAVVGGLAPSIFASIVSVLAYDFFFTEPLYSLRMTDPQDYVSLGAFLVVAVMTGRLTGRVRDEARAARRREVRTAALYAFGRAIADAATTNELCKAIVAHVATRFGTAAGILLPDSGRLVLRAVHSPGTALAADPEAATWACERGETAGRGTARSPDADWLHVPLRTARGAIGVLAIDARVIGVAAAERELLEALAGQAALAIERSLVDVVETIIGSLEDALVVLDRDGIVVHANDVACAILACPRGEMLGRAFGALPTTHPHYVRLRAAVAEFTSRPEHDPSLEVVLFHRGRDRFYVLRPTPIGDRTGAHAGVVLVLQDVTRLRDQEAQRERLVATLSHELRTPLASLRMGVDRLDRAIGDEDGPVRELASAVRRDVERLEDMAHRLLEVSRSRALAVPLERRRVDVPALVARVADAFAMEAAERGVSLTTASAGDPAVAGDPTKISWALSNLVGNALRHTPRGGRVAIDATAADGVVRLVVADTGPGIPREQRERIFERFVQLGDARAGAAGLGLSIVRDVAQAHGGHVRLESDVGRGSRFVVELPRA